jgi:hypothetical protein
MKRCRDFEKTFPLVPDTWHRCHQYAISDTLMPDIRTVWSFGVSKECRMEHWIRKRNGEARSLVPSVFGKLESIIKRFEQSGYKTYCNRLLPKKKTKFPCVELAFYRI